MIRTSDRSISSMTKPASSMKKQKSKQGNQIFVHQISTNTSSQQILSPQVNLKQNINLEELYMKCLIKYSTPENLWTLIWILKICKGIWVIKTFRQFVILLSFYEMYLYERLGEEWGVLLGVDWAEEACLSSFTISPLCIFKFC